MVHKNGSIFLWGKQHCPDGHEAFGDGQNWAEATCRRPKKAATPIINSPKTKSDLFNILYLTLTGLVTTDVTATRLKSIVP